MAKGSTRKRTVSFWYAPASYGGMDINNTVNLLAQHPGVVSTVLVYCGHSANGGLKVDAKTLALCTDGVPHAGQPPLLQALKRQGIAWELVLDSGSSDVDDYRASLFANASVVPALVSSPRRKLSVHAGGTSTSSPRSTSRRAPPTMRSPSPRSAPAPGRHCTRLGYD